MTVLRRVPCASRTSAQAASAHPRFSWGTQRCADVLGRRWREWTELWRSNGFDGGTAPLADIRSGAAGSFPNFLAVNGSIILFSADNGATGSEVWKSDGSIAGTTLLKDINLGAGSGFGPLVPTTLVEFNGDIYFVADDGTSGLEL